MSAASGRVVVITGGTRGIGLGLARELLARDCRVVDLRSLGRRASTPRSPSSPRPRPVASPASPPTSTSRASVQALWDHAVATFGRVDIWINNAGHLRAAAAAAGGLRGDRRGTWSRPTCSAPSTAASVALAGLQAQPDGGWIWNMEGFGSGGQMQPGMAAYGATKRAVTYLTESLVKETKDGNVKVGFLSPGHRRHRPAGRRLRRSARGLREGAQDLQHPR